MKAAYVADLQADQTITSFFLVHDKELRSTREGKPYLHLELGDRTGTVEARLWDNAEQFAGQFDRDDIVKIHARVEIYKSRPQLSVDKLRRAQAGEIDVVDFYEWTPYDVEKLYAELREQAGSIGNPLLRRLVLSVIEDPKIAPKLKRAPAAKSMHHAYLGGLLEHMVSLCALCRTVAGRYSEVNLDLLLTAAILHDVGKLDELTYDRSLGYTDQGHLLGHIVMELDLVRKKMEAIPDFPPNLKTLVEHLLISHHGQYEFGSPKLPMFREAVLFHYLDDLDSKMGAMRATLSSGRGEGVWTERNAALGRRLLRVEKFLEASPSMQAGPDSIGAGSGDPIQLRFEAAAGREEED